jgi:hypothetical protein
MEQYLQLAERLIALIRPKFYNRLTWVVVGAGLLLMSSPWWFDLINGFASRYFGVTLPPYESHLGWGFSLVALGLIYHLAVHYLSEFLHATRTAETRSAHLEHDRKTFSDLVAAMSELQLAEIICDLRDQHAYYSSQGRTLDTATRHLRAPSTQYIDTEVQGSARALGQALAGLREWLSLNFIPYGQPNGNEHRFCLYPELNEDRSSTFPTPEQSRRYDQFAEQLYSKLSHVDSNYAAFRSTVKKALAV